MKQLAKKITRHHSVLVLFYVMLFSLITSCEHQNLEPAQTTQLQLTQAPKYVYVNGYEVFTQAVKENNLSEVKSIVEAGFSPRRPSGPGARTFVHLASQLGRLDILRYFITELNIDPNITPCTGAQTPLHSAIWWGQKDVVVFLIQAGADPRIQDNTGAPSHIATYTGRLSILRYLIEEVQVDPEAKNNAGQTPLHVAAKNDYLDIVKHLIENIRVSPEPTDHQGKTPLHLAAEVNDIETVKYLIEQAKVNPTPMDNQFQTPLNLARAKKCQKVVDYLEKPHPTSLAIM